MPGSERRRLCRPRRRAGARAEVAALAGRLAEDFPATNRGTLQRPDAARPMHVVRNTRLRPGFRAEVAMFPGVMVAAVALAR